MYSYLLIMILPVILAQTGPIGPIGPAPPPDGPSCDYRELYGRLGNLQRRISELEGMTSQAIGFSAYASNNHEYSNTDVVVFDRVITNLGNGYSTSTNHFTCPVHGLYSFSVSIFQSYYMNNPIACAIVLEGREVGEVTVKAFGVEGITDSSSTTTVVECQAGQKVWVKVDDNGGGEVYGDSNEPDTLFSGWLIKTT